MIRIKNKFTAIPSLIGIFLSFIVIAGPTINADARHTSFISPLSFGISETDSIFKNPAELTFYKNIADFKVNFETKENNFGGLLVLHLPDNLPMYAENRIIENKLGDFAFSTEFFGSDFSNNIMTIENEEGDSELTLVEGGFRSAFTWAKRTRFFTFGMNIKYFNYRDLRVSSSRRDALGFDSGLYFSPFSDLFFGVVVNDIGSTTIRDSNRIKINTIAQSVLFSGALIAGDDFSISMGVPLSVLNTLSTTPRTAIKSLSFQGKKIFDDTLESVVGYSNNNIYGTLGWNLNKYINLGVTAIKPASIDSIASVTDMGFIFSITAGFPTSVAIKNMKQSYPGMFSKDRKIKPITRSRRYQNRDSDIYNNYYEPQERVSRNKKRRQIKRRRQIQNKQSRQQIQQNRREENNIMNEDSDDDVIINNIDDEIDKIKLRRLKRKKKEYQNLKKEEALDGSIE